MSRWLLAQLALGFGLVLMSAAGCHGSRSERGKTGESSAPDVTSSARDPAGPVQLCGGRDEPCCGEPLPPCREGFACDLGRCAAIDAAAQVQRLCRASGECEAGEKCCPAGDVGICVLIAGGECPLPDLALSVNSRPDNFSRLIQFTPESCAVQRGCAQALGLRRILFNFYSVLNLGQTDLLLRDATTGATVTSCARPSYAKYYVRQEILDQAGNVVASGNASPVCGLPLSPLQDCRSIVIPAGLSELDEAILFWPGSPDCPLDITDLPPGDYTTRIQVNPEMVWQESDYSNNELSIPLHLPAYGDPREACAEFDPLPPASVEHLQASQECGWLRAPGAEEYTCTPGEQITLDCPDCTGGAPSLRVCNGAGPCSAVDAIGFGEDVFRSAGEEPGGFCGYFCNPLSQCPVSSFQCPEGGSYSTWLLYYGPLDSCSLRRR